MEDALADSEFSVIYENNVKKMDYIKGTEYDIKECVGNLFAIPEKNSVGTNSFNNAIIKIDFETSELKLETIMKDFLPNVYTGKSGFKPVFSDQYIGWIRTRSFALIDYENEKLVDDYMPDGSIYSTLSGAKLINKEKLIFLFGSGDRENFEIKKSLILCEFSDGKGKVVKTKTIGEDDSCIFGKTTFIIRKSENKQQSLYALDSNLNEIDHPLTDFYNKKQKDVEVTELYKPFVHPELPFAIVNNETVDYFDTWLVRWNKYNNMYYHKLSEKLYPEQISPDGKWILFTSFPTEKYVIMPVDTDLKHYLGEPIVLEGFTQSSTEINAWISNPLSFVMSDEDEKKLIKWDISEKNIEKK